MHEQCVAVQAILLVLVLWLVWKQFNKERLNGYLGSGVGSQVFTSGATMRVLAQEFSQPSQGRRITIFNAERKPGEIEKIDVIAHLPEFAQKT